VSAWVASAEAKPEDHVDVLCYWNDVGFDIANYDSDTDQWTLTTHGMFELADASPQFWMPLPDAPKSN
jgi:hypothetical protein